MLSRTLLLTLSLLVFTTGEALRTVRMPAYRKPRTVNSSVLYHPPTFQKHWVPFGSYFTELTVGTPPQTVEVSIDTGSSDLRVPSAQATDFLNSECVGGSFGPAKSSTFRFDTYQPFKISYVDGTSILGDYGLDTVIVGDCSLSNFSFAVADEFYGTVNDLRGTTLGILGINTKIGKSECKWKNCTEDYVKPVISDAMVAAGCISSSSYSLYLNNSETQSGGILFGGVDTAKFKGPLITLRTTPAGPNHIWSGQYAAQQVRLTHLTVHANDTAQLNLSLARGKDAVHLDSGAEGLLLPSDWALRIYDEVQIPRRVTDKLPPLGLPIVPCDSISADHSLEFALADDAGSSIHISMPARDLVVPARNGHHNGTQPWYVNGTEMCAFLLAGSDFKSDSNKGYTILGDVFLHSTYTYYNLDQRTISIAEAVYNSTTENIVAIGKGPVPKLSGTG